MRDRRFQRWRVGDVVEIPLGDGWFGYGWVLDRPLIAFFDLRTRTRTDVEAIVSRPILFEIWVMKYAITKKHWTVIANVEPPPELREPRSFFKRDSITGQLFVYAGGFERNATLEECIGLECAAAWDPEHVEERLRDYFAGVPNKWVESLRPDR